MKVCVVGAGAIGGLIAARLALSGQDVTVIARGAHRDAIRENGLTLLEHDGAERVARVAAPLSYAEAGPQDLVVLGVKAHQVAALLPDVPALLGPDTAILTAQNGIPWWYFFGRPGPHEGVRLESVDPGGAIAAALSTDRIIGSVVYPAATIERPGVIRHVENNRFSLGEIDGRETPRVAAISEAFTDAGFKAPISADLRSEIWMKLWGNSSFNPVSALTHATIAEMCSNPHSHPLVERLMGEARSVGEALGVRFRITIEKRIAGAAAIGAHKTSMLQDVEAGRPPEIDALLGSVIELGRISGVATPCLDTVYALTKTLASVADGRAVTVERQ